MSATTENAEPQDPVAALLSAPVAVMIGSEERANEIMNARYGDVTSSGRILSFGSPKETYADVQEWAKSEFPTRKYDIFNNHINSDKWNFINPRVGDVVIDTSYKSGTTWLQTICLNLVFKGKIPGWEDPNFSGILEMSPWVDMRIFPPHVTANVLESQTHRRVLKSHLPLDAIPYYPEVKYICVARDARDVAYSWANHWWAGREFFEHVFNNVPGLVGPPIPYYEGWSAKKVFLDMALESDSANVGMWSYFHHLATWQAYEHLPNIMILHYSKLKEDPKGEIAKIARYLGIDITDEELDLVVHNTTIGFMKQNNEKILGPGFGAMFEGGGNSFINKGTNNRWEGELTQEEIENYLNYARVRLGEKGAYWASHDGNSL
jgi:aryl sulfotransferase